MELLRECPGLFGSKGETPDAVVTMEKAADDTFAKKFIDAIRQHRFWNRARKNRIRMTPRDDKRGRTGT